MSSTPAAEIGGRRFRPRFWPTIATAVGLAILLALGTWQVKRLAWKTDLIARAEERLALPAIALPSDPDTDWAALDFRRVEVSGTYLHDDAFAFGVSGVDGQPGSMLVTPLALDDGRTLLVERGWLPSAILPPDVPDGLEPQGEVKLTGVLRYRGQPGHNPFEPTNDAQGRRWYGWNLEAMGEAAGEPLLPVSLVLEKSEGPAGLPHAGPVAVEYNNPHLGYAITWYGLAAALVGVYLAFSYEKPKEPS